MKKKNYKLLRAVSIILVALIIGIVVFFVCCFVMDKPSNKQNNTGPFEEEVQSNEYILNDDGSIFFADEQLESSLKKILKLDRIYPEDALEVDYLILRDKSIVSLKGLEFFSNLTYLNLSENKIVDISPLANLTSLKILNLGNNRISDINILSSLVDLEDLTLYANEITDVSSLVNLTKLRGLPTLYNNNVMNLDVLEKNLDLYYNNKLNNYYEITEEDGKIIYETDFFDLGGDDYILEMVKFSDEFDRNEISTYKKAMQVIRNFVKNNISDEMSDLDKEFAIIKFIANSVSYYDTNDDAVTGIHDLYYPFVLKKGQCYHYAKAFNMLGTMAGLKVESAFAGAMHEWNLVNLDGVYYHVDITMADTDGLTDGINYDYVNVSTESINDFHGEDMKYTPLHDLNISSEDMNEEVKKIYY